MNSMRSPEYLVGLVRELQALPKEIEWVEFKENLTDEKEIGEYIAALSNSAALCGKASGYMVWGIHDDTHDIVGTIFQPQLHKVGNEELENWLLRLLNPRINFTFYEIEQAGHRVVILEIARAMGKPVQFQQVEYIRVGSYKKKLKDYPEKERALWRIFDAKPFEELVAVEHVDDAEVLRLIDYPAYFDLLNLPLPDNRQGILERLTADFMIQPNDAGRWNITNLGAILFAKKLDEFKRLSRKAVRVVVYQGNNRTATIKEQIGNRGYAAGFAGLIDYINGLLPRNEVISSALRRSLPMYPELSVRELVANAIIHQDLTITGSGPMIEIFSDRMEITNPGKSLVSTERFLDCPPRSRNELLAAFMRRIGVCEERGSGIDKVVAQTELYQLPAPMFEVIEDNTRATLFTHKELNDMNKDDRIRACYWHACLKYVSKEMMSNTSLRERFGIATQNSAIASRIIRDTLDAGLIRLYDPEASKKYMKYVPHWA